MTFLSTFARPYSPDFNPIEEAFGKVKSWLKRHTEVVQQTQSIAWPRLLNRQDNEKQAYLLLVNF